MLLKHFFVGKIAHSSAGFLAGAIGAALITVAVSQSMFDEKYELGLNHGRLTGLATAMQVLETEFGVANDRQAVGHLFSVKTSSAIVVLVDGVKTVRVVP